MKRTIQSHPFVYGLGCMAIFLFGALGLFALADGKWVNGEPIHALNRSTQTQVDVIETTVGKIDEENHTPFDTLGLNGSASFPTTAADADTMTPYVLTGGNDDWGAWVQLIGSGDMPIRTGKETFDIHDLLISSVSTAEMGRVQIGWDATTTTTIVANEAYSTVMFHPEGIGANVGVGHININTPDLDAGTLVFARCWIDGENGATADIHIEIHEF